MVLPAVHQLSRPDGLREHRFAECGSRASIQATIDREVRKAADLLRLTPISIARRSASPAGQQQRTALARAIVKKANLVLLDEPLCQSRLQAARRTARRTAQDLCRIGRHLRLRHHRTFGSPLLGGNTAKPSAKAASPSSAAPSRSIVSLPISPRPASSPIRRSNTLDVVKVSTSSSVMKRMVLPVPAHLAAIPDGPVTIAFHPHTSPCPHGWLRRSHGPHTGIGDRRVGKLHPRRIRQCPLGQPRARHSRHRTRPGHRRLYRHPNLMAFGARAAPLALRPNWPRERRTDMARINLDHNRHAYNPAARAAGDYALKEVHHEMG